MIPGEIQPADGEIEHLAGHLVWVGKFVYRFMFWELAIDREGTLVRIKKAR